MHQAKLSVGSSTDVTELGREISERLSTVSCSLTTGRNQRTPDHFRLSVNPGLSVANKPGEDIVFMRFARLKLNSISVTLGAIAFVMPLLQGCTDSPPVDPQAFRKIEDQPGLTAGNDDRPINQTPTDSPSVSAADEPNDAGPEESIAPVPEEVYRTSDNRPRHDDARAAELGIRRYESQHLLLYTDIDPAIAETLPPLMDQAYSAWVEYFGPLPPDRENAEYQLTGYIMRDRDRFLAAGMLPDAAQNSLVHGVHRREANSG